MAALIMPCPVLLSGCTCLAGGLQADIADMCLSLGTRGLATSRVVPSLADLRALLVVRARGMLETFPFGTGLLAGAGLLLLALLLRPRCLLLGRWLS